MIHFVVALSSEARPLVSRFRLRAVETEPFRVFAGEAAALVVAGIGKAAAAAATAYLYAARGKRPAAWLNVGVGGHRDRPVGEGALAHKITDAASGVAWYPPLVFEPPGETAAVVTVERPQVEFSDDAIYDMEAAGFLAAASRLATLELVQAFKVISDNLRQPAGEHFDRAFVEGLIAARLGEIEALAGELIGLATQVAATTAEPAGMEPFLDRWRMSVTQKRRLARLLGRHRALTGGRGEAGDLLDGELVATRAAGTLLDRLEERLDEMAARGPLAPGR